MWQLRKIVESEKYRNAYRTDNPNNLGSKLEKPRVAWARTSLYTFSLFTRFAVWNSPSYYFCKWIRVPRKQKLYFFDCQQFFFFFFLTFSSPSLARDSKFIVHKCSVFTRIIIMIDERIRILIQSWWAVGKVERISFNFYNNNSEY